MTEVYKNAFTEVYEIIQYLNECDYNKIPSDVISVIEENMNEGYEYFLDESISLAEQEMLPETKAILFNLFRDYFATKEQKEKILNFQRTERGKLEEKKREEYVKYVDDVFYKKNTIKKEERTINEDIEKKCLIKVEKNNFFSKIVNFIKKLYRN